MFSQLSRIEQSPPKRPMVVRVRLGTPKIKKEGPIHVLLCGDNGSERKPPVLTKHCDVCVLTQWRKLMQSLACEQERSGLVHTPTFPTDMQTQFRNQIESKQCNTNPRKQVTGKQHESVASNLEALVLQDSQSKKKQANKGKFFVERCISHRPNLLSAHKSGIVQHKK